MRELYENRVLVIDMAASTTYVKYMFGGILYCGICTFCLVFGKNYLLSHHLQLKNCNLVQKSTEQLLNRNNDLFTNTIKELEYNAPRGESIDPQKLPYLQSISEVCGHYNISTPLVKRHYLFSPKNSSLYCWIRKIASTSLTKLFSDLRNRRVSKDYYKEIDILSPKTIEQLENLTSDENVFKFLIVRHPFERIVSSYRDRIEDNKKYTAQAWIHAQKIFHLTRPDLFHASEKTGSALQRIFNKDRTLKLVPTFNEFITWLLEEPTSKDDVHWDSYYSHCSVCDINYDYIMKLEDYSFADVDFILSKMGFNQSQAHMPRLEETSSGSTDFQRTCSYFKTLTQDMILKLYQRYKIDFEMFDYRHEDYLKCADSIKS